MMDITKRVRDDFLYEDESYKIGDACKEVWKQFGGSFKESVVDKALTVALLTRDLKVDTQKRIDIYFFGEKVGTYIPDKVINDAIVIEVKCKPALTKDDDRQFWRYLKASPYKLGFLINFSPRRLEFRRRIYDSARKQHSV